MVNYFKTLLGRWSLVSIQQPQREFTPLTILETWNVAVAADKQPFDNNNHLWSDSIAFQNDS